jgi:hypothetical protein
MFIRSNETLWQARICTITLAALAIATLGACGGGENSSLNADVKAHELAGLTSTSAASGASTPPADRKQALAATPVSIDGTLDWAEWKYSNLFPKGPVSYPLTYLSVPYTVRSYDTGNHLGITANGEIFGLGPFTNQILTGFGNVTDYAASVQADACQVYPGLCTKPSGQELNLCADPLWATLPTGHRVTARYDVEQSSTRLEMSLDYQVVGPATFQGVAATQVLVSNISRFPSANGAGPYSEIRSENFMTPVSNGFWQELGNRTLNREGSGPSGPAQLEILTQTVNDPAIPTSPFGLSEGQSITLTTRKTLSVLEPLGQSPFTTTSSTTYTFERRETINVNGRAYDTCRYREAEAGVAEVTTSWYIVGRGIPALIETRSGNSLSSSFRFISGTYGGAPL